jgi:hypothetical protein
MSSKSKRPLVMLVAFLLTLFALPQAHADTYELFQFTDHSGATPVLGIDVAGDVLYGGSTGLCGNTAVVCYSVFQPFGPGIINTATLPLFNHDDGSSCSPNPQATFGSCNNSFEAYSISPPNPNAAVYGGPDTDPQLLVGAIVDGSLLINSFGDIAWTDGQIETNYLAYDVTSHETPEPATLFLLLTGLIPLAVIARTFVPAPKAQ